MQYRKGDRVRVTNPSDQLSLEFKFMEGIVIDASGQWNKRYPIEVRFENGSEEGTKYFFEEKELERVA